MEELKLKLKQKLNVTKTGHVFQSIFLVLCLLLVCMLAYMTFFMDRFVLQAQTAELHRSNLTMVYQANDSITQMAKDLEMQVRMLLSDQNVLHHLLSDEICSAEERMQILQRMKHYVSLTPEVTKLWLYAPFTNTILTSDGFFNDRLNDSISPVLTRSEAQDVPRSASDLRLSSVVLDGNLYILIDFTPAERLGCFVFQLDLSRLDLTLDPELPPILVTDRGGNLLLEGDTPAQSKQHFDLVKTELYYQDLSAQATKQQSHYRAVNDPLGWNLLMEIRSGSDSYNSTFIWAMMFPFLIMILLLGAAGAYYITKKVYAPINRLMNLAANPTQAGDRSKNDIDFLESTFQQTLEDNAALRTAFFTQGREMRQFLCREAIAGRLADDLEADAVREFIPEGRLYAVLIRLGASSVALQEPIKSKVQLSGLERLALQMPECLCWLEESADTVILILHFPSGQHPELSLVARLDAFLAQAKEETSCQMLYGLGGGCDRLHQLKESYDQALRDLQHNTQLASEPDPATARSLKNQVLEDRLSQLLEQPTQSQEDILSQASLILQLTEQGAEDEHERLQRYQLAQNLFTEKLALWEAASSPQEPLDPEYPDIYDQEDFQALCVRVLETGQAMAGKKKFRYVEESKKFIQENYMNCSLSANDISAHVKISPSYFSSLFNELQQESVTSYLNRIRVEQAQHLLATTNIPIKEVGDRCGFNSTNVFGRVFKKQTNMSPSQYRKAFSNLQEGVDSHAQTP